MVSLAVIDLPLVSLVAAVTAVGRLTESLQEILFSSYLIQRERPSVEDLTQQEMPSVES